ASREGHAGGESGDEREVVVVARPEAVKVQAQRYPDVGGGGGIGETRWHDAGDGTLRAVQGDLLADETSVGAVASLPEALADHDHRWAVRNIFIGRERASN